MLPRASKYQGPPYGFMVILIALLEDFKSLPAVLPTSKPKRPGLVKPTTRLRAPEGLVEPDWLSHVIALNPI